MPAQIGQGMKAAILEAVSTIFSFITPSNDSRTLVIGGAALVCLGSLRSTEDVDIVGNPLGLHLIAAAMKEHSDFKLDADGSWRYQSASGISVAIELLAEAGNPGSVLPPLNGKLNICINGVEVHVATLPGLALTKMQAVVDRGKPEDTEDLKWCLEEMIAKDMDMSSVDDVVLQQLAEELVDVADEAMMKLFLRAGIKV